MRLNQSRRRVVGGAAPTIGSGGRSPLLKAHLKAKGCDLPFYDFLDSYEGEFRRTVESAKRNHSTLIDVREVGEGDLPRENWADFESDDLTEITFEGRGRLPRDDEAPRACGRTECFADDSGAIRTRVQIQFSADLDAQPNEVKYLFALFTLWVEIGRVHDIEHEINFSIAAGTMSAIDGAVFAHLFAFEMLAKRALKQSYDYQVNALNVAMAKDGYGAEVARRVLERLPNHKILNWSDFL